MNTVSKSPRVESPRVEKPRVAIVIVNWNKRDYVLSLLSSLSSLEYDDYEVIVVDNASTDDSVKALKRDYPGVTLIENAENLGGTGGFNTGLRFGLGKKDDFKYLWLLDNDAEIEPETLRELVNTMEGDESIGLAGSRIVDIDDKEITIETGSMLRWDTIGVMPVSRNIKGEIGGDSRDTEYVAICSALVRISALEKVGLMDERFFIFWDDMDWGLYFKEHGYRVVAVPKSVAYHGSFTERERGVVSDFYYGTRNPLLVYSKHTNPLKRLLIFYNYLRYLFKGLTLLLINNHRNKVRLMVSALSDFCHNRWGRCTLRVESDALKNAGVDLGSLNVEPNEILIVAADIKENVLSIKESAKEAFPKASVSLLVNDDRIDIFKTHFDKYIVFDSKSSDSLYYNLKLFIRIALSGYDLVLTPSLSPFSYAAKKCYQFVSERDSFVRTDNDLYHLHKPIIATVIGELASIIITPFIFLKSLRYKRWRGF